jgi:hypothetical protein
MALTLLKDESELQSYVASNPSSYIVVKGYFYVGLDPTTVQQYKNVLTAANQDYLIVSGGSTWVNASDIDFEIEGDFTHVSGNEALFSRGINNSGTTGLIYCFRASSTSATMSIFDFNGTSQQSIIGIPLLDGYFKLTVKNLEVFVNGVLYDTMTEQTVNISQDNTVFGKLAYANIWYLNGSIYAVKYDGETFGLNEPSGATFTGSLGTTGTRVTSSLDPNYIDDIMIQPYNP